MLHFRPHFQQYNSSGSIYDWNAVWEDTDQTVQTLKSVRKILKNGYNFMRSTYFLSFMRSYYFLFNPNPPFPSPTPPHPFPVGVNCERKIASPCANSSFLQEWIQFWKDWIVQESKLEVLKVVFPHKTWRKKPRGVVTRLKTRFHMSLLV